MNTKVSIINILMPFLYISLVYITCLYIWIFLWVELSNFLCGNIMNTADVCNIKPIDSWDDTGVFKAFMYFVFPIRLAFAVFWFFVLKYLRRKIREKFKV
jgi:hypothetical protein